MSKIYDLTGQRFGRLLVIRLANKEESSNRAWYCKCDCGNSKIVLTSPLMKGNISSCGCLKTEMNKNNINQFNDLTGKTFNEWTVLERVENKGRQTAYLCRCSCGTEKVLERASIVHNRSKSCGCKSNNRHIDLSGTRQGMLQIIKPIKYTTPSGRERYKWLCRCDCGTEKIMRLESRTKSCGCLNKSVCKDHLGNTFNSMIDRNQYWLVGATSKNTIRTKQSTPFIIGKIAVLECIESTNEHSYYHIVTHNNDDIWSLDDIHEYQKSHENYSLSGT